MNQTIFRQDGYHMRSHSETRWASVMNVLEAHDAEQETGIPVVFAYGRPEMLHGELFHGVLSYFTPKGVASFSTCEIGELVKQYLGLHAFAAFISAGEHQRRPDFVMVGDALEEVISSWQDRPDREAYMRGIHAPLNARKIENHRQLTRSEWLLAEFSTRTANARLSQEVA